MKKLITIMLGLFTLAFILKETARTEMPLSPPPSQNNLDNRFLVGAIQSFDDRWHNYSHYDELGFNYVHTYIGTTPDPDPVTGRYYPLGYMAWNDRLFTPVSEYAAEVNGYINAAHLHNNSRFSLHRPKLEWLCYGQRSDYKCNRDHIDPALWFYSFQTHNNDPDFLDEQYGNRWVRFCRTSNSTNQGNWVTAPGMVVNRLKANTEQSRLNWPIGETMNMWQCDNQCDWLIKPSIRGDQAFISNQANENVNICRIDVYNQNGYDPQNPALNRIKSVDIKARYFQLDYQSQNQYQGQYIEDFFFPQGTNLTIQGPWGASTFWSARGNRIESEIWNHADIQVYWYGYCDMWLDYVRVDNDVADQIFKGYYDDPSHPENQWIKNEVVQIANATYPVISNYRLEYCEFNNLPCIAYVNRKLREYSTDHNLTVTPDWYVFYSGHVPWENRSGVLTAEHIKRFFVDSLQLSAFHAENYPYRSVGDDPPSSSCFSKIPNTLPKSDCGGNPPCGILGYPVSPAAYDVFLQVNMDHQPEIYTSDIPWDQTEVDWDRGMFRVVMNLGNQISKMAHIPFIHMPAAHLWFNDEEHTENQREPTNEELDLQANLSVSYGARGLIYFWWWSGGQPGQTGYNRGIVEMNGSLRLQNVYEEAKTKKQAFIDIANRLKAWEPYLMNFDYDYTNSYIYYDPSERADFLASTYFNEVLTYPPDINNWENPASQPDAPNYRYVQAAVFNNDDDPAYITKYFMLVNRRCSPYYPVGHPLYPNGENGGRRNVKVKFDINGLSPFNNWKIVNLKDNSVTATFDKRTGSAIDLDWYMPGEGRLYKLVPVMIDGGTFVCDEEIDNQFFSCYGLVENAGHNLIITGSSTNISFENWSTINFNGGLFQSGDPYDDGPQKITFTSADQWTGFNISNATVKIYGSKFGKLGQNSGEVYALTLTDCGLTDIRNCVFESPYYYDNVGSINSQYLFPDEPQEVNQYFIGNTFTMESYSSEIPVLKLQSYASIVVPVYIQSNIFSCSGSYPSAVYLSNIYNGVVDQNMIHGFATGIEALSSDISLFGNNISNSSYTSRCLYGSAASNLFMSQTGDYMLGGSNIFINSLGDNSKNVEVVNSTFNIYNGDNIFDVQASFPIQTWHLYGTFPRTPYTTNAEYNCFKISGTPYIEPQPPNCCIMEGNNLIYFSFFPYSCTGGVQGDNIVINIGNGVNDSVETAPGGGGGGGKISELGFSISELKAKAEYRSSEKSNVKSETENTKAKYKSSEKSKVKRETEKTESKSKSKAESKIETKAKTDAENKTNYSKFKIVNSQFILNPQTLYDSLNILMRFRNYSASRNKAIELITAYPDSIQSVNSLGMLYYSSLVTDTSEAGALNLKTYYENLILNHPGNIPLIKRSNYFAQKCKVRLRQYNSAMSGFQQIMNQDPYSYEALLARWDYMATNILDSLSGGSLYGEGGDDDRSPFTKEERKQIRENTRVVIEQSNINEERNIEKLKIQTESGDKNAERELKVKQVLKDIAKPEHPKSIIEHIKIVNGDIKKISAANKVVNVSNRKNNIPLAYRLAQNYPNPFNPATTILYELPKNSKVKLVIYDILGREVKILVHNEIKSAGYYKVEFNMQNYASGVYFYRIETDDLKGGKFVDAKKMVLVK